MTITAARATLPVCILACIVCAEAAVAAGDFVPRITLGAAYSDNVDRALVEHRQDVFYSANLGFNYVRNSERFVADIDAEYQYNGYVRNTFSSENLFGLSGSAIWRIVPESLNWFVEDQFGQVASRPFGALTPITRENINYFTTGPTWQLRLGSTNVLSLKGLYANARYDVSDIDNDRLMSGVQLLHRLSANSSISVNGDHTRVEFSETDAYPNYQFNRGFVRYEAAALRTSLRADIGIMATYDGVDTRKQTLLGVTAYRLIGAFSTLGFDIRQGFSDSAEEFRFDQEGALAGSGDQDVLVRASPFEERRASVFYQLAKTRASAQITSFYSREDFKDDTNSDRNVVGGEVNIGYRVSSKLSLSGYARFEEVKQASSGEKDVDKLVGVEGIEQMTRSTSLRLLIERYERNTNIAQGFVENRVTLSIRYQPEVIGRTQGYDPYRGRGVEQPTRPVTSRGRTSPGR